jgi:DNA-binding GntR family transcriptional regulator
MDLDPIVTRSELAGGRRRRRKSAAPGYRPRAALVTGELRAAILDGRLKPGDPIRQEAVARWYGTSRIPVREALHQLENEGLVTIVPHAGAHVARLDFEEFVDIYKIRERLEPLALVESMPNLSVAAREHLRRLAAEIETATGDANRWLEADRAFHLATYAGLRSARLLRMIESFWNSTQQYRRVLFATSPGQDFEIMHLEHRVLVDLIERRDEASAEAILRSHIARTRHRLAEHRELFDT